MEPTVPASSDATRILPAELLSELEAICFRSTNEESRRERLATLLVRNTGHQDAIHRFLQSLELPVPGAPEVRHVGPYRILSELGRGGFGEVYLAEQEVPVRRRVALKVLKLGMDSRAILARFAREQASLARMNHDAVAKIFDAGTTPQGQSFFAMELVEGQPITQHCDAHQLDLRQRIELFQRVCLGVQHAHQKGVVHRDLKPGNVLVALVSDLHQPKLIDFGIARAIEGDDAEPALTETGMVLGTPAYMAPEQAKGDPSLVDTRTDVYALGAILYELLTGSQPLVEQVGSPESPWDLRQRILAAETPRPSLRASADPTTLAQRAQDRRMAPSTWLRSLRGDLDWIVLTAMAKAAEYRYASAAELAADLGRYLRQEPVLAGPPSAMYRLRKFVRRYRGQTVAAGLVLVAIVVGTISTFVQYGRAEDKAAESQRLARVADASAADARVEAQRARAAESLEKQRSTELKQIAEFQASQLSGIDTEGIGVRLRSSILERVDEAGRADAEAALNRVNFTDVALGLLDREVFVRALDAIGPEFLAETPARGLMMQSMADTLTALGIFDRALEVQEKALALVRRLRGDEDRDVLRMADKLSGLLSNRGRLAEAESLQRSTLEVQRRCFGVEDPEAIACFHNLGTILATAERLDEAESILREVLVLRERTSGPHSIETADASGNLGALLHRRGQLEEAAQRVLAVVEIRTASLGSEDPATLRAMSNLAAILLSQDNGAGAEALTRAVLDVRKRQLGDDHLDTVSSAYDLGCILGESGQLAEAEPVVRSALASRSKQLGDDHPHTLMARASFGSLLESRGRLEEAAAQFADILERSRRTMGPAHSNTIGAAFKYCNVRETQGRIVEVGPLLSEVAKTSREVLGENHPTTLQLGCFEASLLNAQGDVAAAESRLREVLYVHRQVLGSSHASTAKVLDRLTKSLLARRAYEDAAVIHSDMLEALRTELGEDHAKTLRAINKLGFVLQLGNQLDAAESHFRDAHERMGRVLGKEDAETLNALNNLGYVLKLQGKLPAAEQAYMEALDGSRRTLGKGHADTLALNSNLANLLEKMGRRDEAVAYLRDTVEEERLRVGSQHRDALIPVSRLGLLLVRAKRYDEAVTLLAATESAARATLLGTDARYLADLLLALGKAYAGLHDPSKFIVAESTLLDALRMATELHGPGHAARMAAMRSLAELHRIWHAREPGRGHDDRAREWQAQVDSATPEASATGR